MTELFSRPRHKTNRPEEDIRHMVVAVNEELFLRVSDSELSESSGLLFLSNGQSEDGHLVGGPVEVVGVTL